MSRELLKRTGFDSETGQEMENHYSHGGCSGLGSKELRANSSRYDWIMEREYKRETTEWMV